jgi:hypothetical protein
MSHVFNKYILFVESELRGIGRSGGLDKILGELEESEFPWAASKRVRVRNE